MNLHELPADLPIPEDDGLAAHLIGQELPNLALPATSGLTINLSETPGWVVIYCYPMTGQPGIELPAGWNDIPGARGCTPQSCAFRDHHSEIRELGATVFGLSTQGTLYQQEMADRLHLPFAVLSDEKLEFSSALKLPTMSVGGMTLIKRLTLICHSALIYQVHYPVFPPHVDPERVITWLRKNRSTSATQTDTQQ